MKKSRFTEAQIAFALRQAESGTPVAEIIRKLGIAFYTAGVGLLSSSLFVPTIAGLWWKRANRAGGVAAVVAGAVVYGLGGFGGINIGVPPIVVALLASALGMILGGLFGAPEKPEMIAEIESLHA
jgi:Na+/pantothenate symporter